MQNGHLIWPHRECDMQSLVCTSGWKGLCWWSKENFYAKGFGSWIFLIVLKIIIYIWK